MNVELDQKSFQIGRLVGSMNAWCEAARGGAKQMSLSSPFSSAEYEVMLPYMEAAAKQYGIGFYLEKDLMTTDLFTEYEMKGRWVFIIYDKEETIQGYLSLKAKKEKLEKERKYEGEARTDIAVRLGKLLGYSEAYISRRLQGLITSKNAWEIHRSSFR